MSRDSEGDISLRKVPSFRWDIQTDVLTLRCCAFFTMLSVWLDHFSWSMMCTLRNLKLSTFSTTVRGP
jgi:hypothetical protein